ncbi:MAG: NAD(P)H-dependent flavin oxidoreductase [Halanaerobiales bacterium]
MKMKDLIIGNLKAKLPIIQGGMGVGISLSGLASAVADEGGIGVISSACVGMFEKDLNDNYLEANIRALKSTIRKAREKTDGILGVNIMKALTNFSDMVKTSIRERVDIIFVGAGLPLNLPQFLEEYDETKLVPIVSSGRAAAIIAKRWIKKFDYIPDAFVVEGPKAGGHLGFKPEQLNDKRFTLDKLVIKVLESLRPIENKVNKKIPVIAAGGVYTGGDICELIDLGASGVQMATRFVTTEECDASESFKKAYIQSKKEDLEIIESPVGMPGRVIHNQFVEKVSAGEKKPFSCPYHCIKTCEKDDSPYCIALALINAQQGRMSHGFAFAGENAYRAEEIISVSKLIKDLKKEYQKACLVV